MVNAGAILAAMLFYTHIFTLHDSYSLEGKLNCVKPVLPYKRRRGEDFRGVTKFVLNKRLVYDCNDSDMSRKCYAFNSLFGL